MTPAFQDRPVQPGAANDLLGRPFALVIARTTVRPGTQEAQHRDPPDPARRAASAIRWRVQDVHGAVGLRSDLAVDPGALDHHRAARERPIDVVVMTEGDDLVAQPRLPYIPVFGRRGFKSKLVRPVAVDDVARVLSAA